MKATGSAPLIVDLDGTLTPADTLVESVITLVKHYPLYLLRLPIWLMRGRAAFKEKVASHVSISAETLPYHQPLLGYLLGEKEKGRRIILATAAHESIAAGVSAHLGLFDAVLATAGTCNLKGNAKLESIHKNVGDKFVYAGNGHDDIPIWRAARAAVLVGVSSRIADSIRRDVSIEMEFPKEPLGLGTWLRAFRIHQWLKNLLLFVPLLTAFSFMEVTKLITVTVAFLAFSFAASATYLVNDLLDLDNDRAHLRKRLRPFANAKIPVVYGLAAASGAMILALTLAIVVSRGFFLMVLLYVFLTSAYSLWLKEFVLIDVLTLSLLYTLRILAGSVAIAVATSSWLLAFSVFIFLSLALMKRCSELVSLEQIGKESTRGRDYQVADLVVLWPLGVGTAVSAVVVFGLFISAPEVQSRYATPQLLWLVAFGLIYWIARLWLKTSRGQMTDDPMIYAISNPNSFCALIAMIASTMLAHFI